MKAESLEEDIPPVGSGCEELPSFMSGKSQNDSLSKIWRFSPIAGMKLAESALSLLPERFDKFLKGAVEYLQ